MIENDQCSMSLMSHCANCDVLEQLVVCADCEVLEYFVCQSCIILKEKPNIKKGSIETKKN